MFQFLDAFETHHQENLTNFQSTGILDFTIEEVIEYIINSFDVDLVFPMTLAHSIPPLELEKIKSNLIQKAIFNLAKELLSTKSFFFINNMLNRLKKIVKIEADVVLYEIHQLLIRNIIVPTSIEAIAQKIETHKEASQERLSKSKPISSIIITDSDFDQLKERIKYFDKESAKNLIKEFIKKGKIASKDLTYQQTQKEYNKALFIAKEYNLKDDIQKISQKLFDLESKSKYIELDYNIEKAEISENNGDFINSINYYQKALLIMEGFLVYNVVDPRIKKFKKKIFKLREEI